jgi:hypothetical protein
MTNPLDALKEKVSEASKPVREPITALVAQLAAHCG